MAHTISVTKLAEEINKASSDYRVGALQELRRKLHGGAATRKIFSKRTIHENEKDNYAYHDGGRTELQFNIGPDQGCWRHGVAFEFKKDRNLLDPRGILGPRVASFNIWVRSNGDALHGFRMWDWSCVRSNTEAVHESRIGGKVQWVNPDRPPGEILNEMLDDFIQREAFVFLGVRVPEASVNVTQILRDFDRLFDLYEYVESHSGRGTSRPVIAPPGQTSTATKTTASHLAGVIEVDLREKLLQGVLEKILKNEFPGCPVHPQFKVAEDCRVDVKVDTPNGVVFSEIKVAPHVRAAVRQAIGQLLEYAHWPTEHRAKKLWVVSEEMPSAEDIAYLKALRTWYGLPVFYRRIDAEAGILEPEK